MARTDERGGPRTRARIAETAAGLFLERGFDDVTVAEIARAAGVSSVTVFKHFPRKEDLFLDRSSDAEELLRSAVRDRTSGMDVLDSLRARTERLVDDGHPLSGTDPRSVAFFITVAGSPALIARAREIAAELASTLAGELDDDPGFAGDGQLLAVLFVAGYGSVLVRTARQLLAGETGPVLIADHRARLGLLFDTFRNGVALG
jgi:AcrR family transcriptional regulator